MRVNRDRTFLYTVIRDFRSDDHGNSLRFTEYCSRLTQLDNLNRLNGTIVE